MSHEDTIISDYSKKMSIILFCGVLLSAIIGYTVAQEGLRPLKAMTMAFKGIGPKELQKRIGSREWPDEIAILADAFDKMLGRLENSFTALSQFSADLAHELRTPINNLRGEAEVALFKARTEQEYRQVLESSLEEYERLSRMIENLLFLAHADRRDALVRRSLISVHKEIGALLEYYEAMAEEKGIKVIFSGTGALEADPVCFARPLVTFSQMHFNTLLRVVRSRSRRRNLITVLYASILSILVLVLMKKICQKFSIVFTEAKRHEFITHRVQVWVLL